MIEIERQVCEAPDICVIVQGDPITGHAYVSRFTDEDGETIAESGSILFGLIYADYAEEVEAAIEDCRDEMGYPFDLLKDVDL